MPAFSQRAANGLYSFGVLRILAVSAGIFSQLNQSSNKSHGVGERLLPVSTMKSVSAVKGQHPSRFFFALLVWRAFDGVGWKRSVTDAIMTLRSVTTIATAIQICVGDSSMVYNGGGRIMVQTGCVTRAFASLWEEGS